MPWTVKVSSRVDKNLRTFPQKVRDAYAALAREIELYGPVRGNWPNYGKLGTIRHHCHLRKGKPAYVAVWEEAVGEVRIIEVIYVGTHEKAPY
ncbi:MAG TPA: hypothetical protein VEF34_14335 [Syntrophobacteraceae bacterium]|nr:hypothetical protein [Syntrophobacteraceae bacterium]